MKANFINKKGNSHPLMMGCYGIGLGRLMAAIVEIHHDKAGIIWPESVAPFSVYVIAIEKTLKVKKVAEKLYQNLHKTKLEVLYDDRKEKTPGEKFADCDLLGIPWRLVVSEKSLAENSVELKQRNKRQMKLIKIKDILIYLSAKIRSE